MIKRIIFSLITIAILFSCSSRTKTYLDTQYGFSFDYPYNWRIADKSTQSQVLVYEPLEDDEKNVITNISVSVKNNYDIPLDIRGELTEQEWKDSNEYKNIKILTKKKEEFRKQKAIIYVCEADVVNIKTQWKKIIFIKDSLFYDISITTSKDKFQKQTNIINNTIDSFSLESN